MTTMQRIALLLAVCACGTLIVSSRAQTDVKTAAAIPSMAEYEAADYTHVCLRATSILDADIVALLSGLYIEQGLQCCKADKPYYGDHDSMTDTLIGLNSIGKCSWTFNPFLFELIRLGVCLENSLTSSITPLPEGVTCTTFKLGTYSVECAFNKGSEDCGDGVCDDMILQSTGNMYWTPEAYLKSLPTLTGAATLGGLDLFGLRTGARDGVVGVDSLIQQISSAYSIMLPGWQAPVPNVDLSRKQAKLESTNKYGQPEHAFTLGAALITSGPVSIFSKHSNLKYKEGFLHSTPLYWRTGDIGTAVPGPNSLVVDPYRYDLKLKRSGAY